MTLNKITIEFDGTNLEVYRVDQVVELLTDIEVLLELSFDSISEQEKKNFGSWYDSQKLVDDKFELMHLVDKMSVWQSYQAKFVAFLIKKQLGEEVK